MGEALRESRTAADLFARHVNGESLREIARDMGITRERVRQIVNTYAADHATTSGGRQEGSDA